MDDAFIKYDTRSLLRKSTHDVHERLHGHPLFVSLLKQIITLDAYKTLLSRLYGFHKPVEDAICHHAEEYPDLNLNNRRRAHLISEDLQALGLSESDVLALPLCAAPERFKSLSDLL